MTSHLQSGEQMALEAPGCVVCRSTNNSINLQWCNTSLITLPSFDPCATDDLILVKCGLETPADRKRDRSLQVMGPGFQHLCFVRSPDKTQQTNKQKRLPPTRLHRSQSLFHSHYHSDESFLKQSCGLGHSFSRLQECLSYWDLQIKRALWI